MERNVVTGIAHDLNEARVTLSGLPDRPGAVAAVFAPLAAANVNVDMIVQSVPRAGAPSDLTFTVPTASLPHTVAELEKIKSAAGFTDSHWVRAAFGTVAYGFFPARTFGADMAARLVHSADERIAVDDLELGTRFLCDVARAIGSA